MMKIALINGSPKKIDSASGVLLKMVEENLNESGSDNIFKCHIYSECNKEETLEKLAECDTLLIAYPLYIDTLPSHVLRFMKTFEDYLKTQNNQKERRVFAISNCGYYEARHNKVGISVVENWTSHIGALFAGAVAVGGGGMIPSVYKSAGNNGPLKTISASMKKLADKINDETNKEGEIQEVHPAFPFFLYKKVSHNLWNKMAKENGLTKKDLEIKTQEA